MKSISSLQSVPGCLCPATVISVLLQSLSILVLSLSFSWPVMAVPPGVLHKILNNKTQVTNPQVNKTWINKPQVNKFQVNKTQVKRLRVTRPQEKYSALIQSNTIAQDDPWFFQSLLAVSADTDFHDSVVGLDYEQSREYTSLSGFSVGKKVGDNFFVWPFDIYAYASLQYFNERGFQPNGWGVTAYVKAYHIFNLAFTNMPIRLGFGNGLSYVSRIPVSEAREFSPFESEKLIYYMDYSLQVSLNYLLGRSEGNFSSDVADAYMGYAIWHRSSVFGLFADSTNGINYLGLNLELSLK